MDPIELDTLAESLAEKIGSQLARDLAVLLDPNALMNTEDVGAFFRCSVRHAAERVVKRKGFPAPVKFEGVRSHRLWLRQDVIAYVLAQTKRRGRPRKPIVW